MRLDFNETNILTQVLMEILSNPSKESLISLLTELEENTSNKILIQSVCSLREKLMNINQHQLNKVYQDLANNNISATRAYALPAKEKEEI